MFIFAFTLFAITTLSPRCRFFFAAAVFFCHAAADAADAAYFLRAPGYATPAIFMPR
jgi:hypothetical protein